jgi:hypothetical protein
LKKYALVQRLVRIPHLPAFRRALPRCFMFVDSGQPSWEGSSFPFFVVVVAGIRSEEEDLEGKKDKF